MGKKIFLILLSLVLLFSMISSVSAITTGNSTLFWVVSANKNEISNNTGIQKFINLTVVVYGFEQLANRSALNATNVSFYYQSLGQADWTLIGTVINHSALNFGTGNNTFFNFTNFNTRSLNDSSYKNILFNATLQGNNSGNYGVLNSSVLTAMTLDNTVPEANFDNTAIADYDFVTTDFIIRSLADYNTTGNCNIYFDDIQYVGTKGGDGKCSRTITAELLGGCGRTIPYYFNVTDGTNQTTSNTRYVKTSACNTGTKVINLPIGEGGGKGQIESVKGFFQTTNGRLTILGIFIVVVLVVVYLIVRKDR